MKKAKGNGQMKRGNAKNGKYKTSHKKAAPKKKGNKRPYSPPKKGTRHA